MIRIINNSLAMEDAKSISFDLETLKKFIYHIEAITKQNDDNITSERLGVRIYYAAYPEIENWNDYQECNNKRSYV